MPYSVKHTTVTSDPISLRDLNAREGCIPSNANFSRKRVHHARFVQLRKKSRENTMERTPDVYYLITIRGEEKEYVRHYMKIGDVLTNDDPGLSRFRFEKRDESSLAISIEEIVSDAEKRTTQRNYHRDDELELLIDYEVHWEHVST